jgi:hypothetical protein
MANAERVAKAKKSLKATMKGKAKTETAKVPARQEPTVTRPRTSAGASGVAEEGW